jgi:hypothetical protein
MSLRTQRWTPDTHSATWFEWEWDDADDTRFVLVDGMVAGQTSANLEADFARVKAENQAINAARQAAARDAEIAELQQSIADTRARLAELGGG